MLHTPYFHELIMKCFMNSVPGLKGLHQVYGGRPANLWTFCADVKP